MTARQTERYGEVVRTPAARFAQVPDFDYPAHYLEALPALRLAYLDRVPHDRVPHDRVPHDRVPHDRVPHEGVERSGETYLCLHGEPTWSFLYRKMLPPLLASGGRVVAPDFYGFGRSDKPVSDDVYSFDFHLDTLRAFVLRLDLKDITLVCQDWGGILGLALVPEMPERFSRLIVMNTAIPTGHIAPSEGFLAWRDYVKNTPDFDVAGLMKRACPSLSEAELAAYDAPFPDARFKAGVRTFPALVPTELDAPGADRARVAAAFFSQDWDKPTFMAVGAQDPVLGVPVMKMMQQLIKGCPEPLVLDDAGHFVQEAGERVVAAALASFAR